MTDIRVKVFHEETDKSTEDQVNEWITIHNPDVIDIKFQLAGESYPSVLVIYKIKGGQNDRQT